MISQLGKSKASLDLLELQSAFRSFVGIDKLTDLVWQWSPLERSGKKH